MVTFDEEGAALGGEDQPVLEPYVAADDLVGKIGINAPGLPRPGLQGADRGEGGGRETTHDSLQLQSLSDSHHLDGARLLSPSSRRLDDVRERPAV